MRAMAQASWRVGEPLVPVELPAPEPGRGELRVAVQAIGVNPVDWKMRTGGPVRLLARLSGPPPPIVLGVDFAGVVEAVGDGVVLAVGTRVVGGTDFSRKQRGSYADTVLVRADQLAALPDAVGFDVAVALPVAGVTAWQSLHEIGRLGAAPDGERRVLVLGAAGGVGQLAVQVAKAAGAFVAGVCSSENVARVRALGADEVIDYRAGDALAAAAAHRPYRVIVDAAGSYAAGRCRALLGRGGRHVMVAAPTVGDRLQVLVPPFRSRLLLARATTARLAPLVELIASGRLHVEIAARFPLADVEAAHRLSQTGRVAGKILLTP